jgi:uncharacterized membrane protein
MHNGGSDSATRLHLLWTPVRDSLWFVPSVGALAGVLLAIVAVEIPTPDSPSRLARVWLFGGGAAGARGMLSAIAGSLITVTGVVFSVTIVALQLASSQFTPRVLGSFVADRVNQIVLGVFIGTFTYSLLVLRTIRSEAEDRTPFVPHVAVTFALLLLLVSIAALIIFINHSARSIQASVILQRETTRALAKVKALFPERLDRPTAVPAETVRAPTALDDAPSFLMSAASGYVQAIHLGALWALRDGHDDADDDARHTVPRRGAITIRIDVPIGAFVFPGTRLASIWPAHAADAAAARAIQAAFVLGPERTNERTGCRVRARRHCRHRIACTFTRHQRSDHGDALHRSADRDPCRAGDA